MIHQLDPVAIPGGRERLKLPLVSRVTCGICAKLARKCWYKPLQRQNQYHSQCNVSITILQELTRSSSVCQDAPTYTDFDVKF